MSGRLAITHAGGPLAEALLGQLQESGVAPDSLVLLDREERIGNRIAYGDSYLSLEDQRAFDFEALCGVLLLEQDAELADLLQHAECPVISHLPLSADAPLWVPGEEQELPDRGFIKLPAADVATVLPVIHALQQGFGLSALHLVSVLSAMHLGQAGVDDLAAQTIGLLNSRDIDAGVFPQPLAFNLLPLPGPDTGELHRLIGDDTLNLGHQQLLAPAFHGLAIAVAADLDNPAEIDQVSRKLADIGFRISEQAISPRSHCQQGSACWIGHLQQPEGDPARLQFWLVADSVRNGWLAFYRSAADFLLKSVL